MRKIFFYVFAIAIVGIMSSCSSSNNGELIGVQERSTWYQTEPHGMAFVPSGVFQTGQSGEDIMYSLNAPVKTVSVKAFFMDDTEISNNEYRQFVYWVRDSIAHTILGHVEENPNGYEVILWDEEINYGDVEVRDELSEMYYDEGQRIAGKIEMDTRTFNYTYSYYDFFEAAKNANRGKPRTDFIRTIESINVYPDTLVWVRDFQFSYNEPQTQHYFSHPAYDDYPVVGVDWAQANAFCNWRTELLNRFRHTKGLAEMPPFRLPTEWEFEYASRGGHNTSPYPWGGPYIRNDKGCFLANFKPGRGNYSDDGGFYTVKVYSYNPNDYALYNTSGNVAEWTSTAYEEAISQSVHDLNPDFKYNHQREDHKVMKRKVIRGGSWKDIGYFLQNSTRTFEYADSAKSYIGFRCAMDFLGRSIEDFQ